jgi:predicted RNase H-like HicB family nuclease
MEISVLVEKVADNGYRARGAEPFGFTAEATTRDEAVAKVQELCQARLNGGAEIVTVVVSPSPHPWAPFAGIFKDDPDFQEVVEIIAENRRKMDTDETIP